MLNTISSQFRKVVVKEIVKEMETGIRFAVAGNRGFGKTSTVNALFKVNMHVSASKPATTEIHEVEFKVPDVLSLDEKSKQDINLYVYDLPGLGEGIAKNTQKYFGMYESLMSNNVDAILWVLRADVSAFQQDIDYISELIRKIPGLKSRIVIGLNRADAIEPNNWNYRINQPSLEQKQELNIIQNQARKLVHNQCGLTTNVVTYYSAKQAWQLSILFNQLMSVVPEGRKWLFARLQNEYRDAYLSKVSPEFQKQVAEVYDRVFSDNK